MADRTSAELAAIAARLRAAGCVFAEEEAALLAESASGAELEARVARRAAGEPLEHLLGWVAFRGMRVAVEPGVFVPRRRTELLAKLGARHASPGSVVVELCCGAAAVASSIAREVPGVRLLAADIDPVAARCASRNLAGIGEVVTGDLFAPLPSAVRGAVDVLVVNAPYVPTGEIALMPAEARSHEPLSALDGGADGLALHRRIAAEARAWLAPGGTLLIETSARQARRTARIVAEGGLDSRIRTSAHLDATVVEGRRGA